MPNLKLPVHDGKVDDSTYEPVPPIPPVPPVPPVTPPNPKETPIPTTKVTIEGKEYALDNDGNALGDDGKIFKTKAELSATPPTPPVLPTNKEVIIDDITYKLNEKGDALKPDGTIFMSKEDITKLENAEEEIDNISFLQTVLDYKPVKDGKPVVYENTEAGMTQLANDAIIEKANELATSLVDKFFNDNPDIKQMRTHKILTGSLQGFVPQQDWDKVDIEALSDDDIVKILTFERQSKGDSPEIIKFYLEGIKKDNKLKEFGKNAITYLSLKQKEQEAAANNAIKEQNVAAERDRINYWNAVDTSLRNKKITVNNETFTLPDTFRVLEGDGKAVIKTIADFNDYIKTTRVFVINGKKVQLTQNMYDAYTEQLNHKPDNDILEALRRFLKYDDAQLINIKAKTAEIEKVRRLVSRTPGKTDTPSGGPLKLKLPVRSNF